MHIVVRNANEEDLDSFYEITEDVINKVVEEGLDKKTLEGTINRMEFMLREGDSPQKGLIYGMQLLSGWFYEGNPYKGLEFEKPLAEIKRSLEEDYMEQLIKEDLLSNNHSLLLALKPEPGLQARIDKEIRAELEFVKEDMDREKIKELVEQTNELIEYQQREDTPEALETIPMLSLDDISKEIGWYEAEEREIGGIKTLYLNEFTNGIMYNRILFDLRTLPLDKIQYASLLSNLLGKFDTENYSYGELDNELNIHTGGFSSFLFIYNGDLDNSNYIPKFIIQSKSLRAKTGKMLELAGEIINTSDYTDKERLKTLLVRHYAAVEANIKNNGLNYAARRMQSYYGQTGLLNEMISGLEYYWFLDGLVKNFDEKADEIIAGLQETAASLFNTSNMTAAITCTKDDYENYSGELDLCASSMPAGEMNRMDWDLVPVKKNEALKTTSKVQYVVKGANFKDLGYEWSGNILVLSQILSIDWLQNQIRVIGGAYGGFSGFQRTGDMFFGSYCDPNLRESLEVYNKTAGYLEDFDADEKSMTRYIIGTISDMDYPETASMKAGTALSRYFNGISREFMQAERDDVLSTTADDISAMKTMVEELMGQDYYCVYGNNEKIGNNADLFMDIINPLK